MSREMEMRDSGPYDYQPQGTTLGAASLEVNLLDRQGVSSFYITSVVTQELEDE